MIRDKIVVHCDATGCQRSTEATCRAVLWMRIDIQFPARIAQSQDPKS